MADLKISQLTGATTPLAGTEVLPIVQSSTTRKIATDDLTVKNVRSNATTGILQIAGPATAATRTMTVPDANFTVARTDAAQSFTGDQTLSTGNLVQGTAAKGVNFTANTPAAGMTSQLLNWYEEGTWTPTDQSGAALTFTGVSGQYVRTGKIVQCAFAFTFPATASALNVSIGGLPFTSDSSDTGWGGYQTYTDYVTAQLAFLVNISATTFTMWRNGSTIVTNITLTGNTVRGVINYRAA